MNDNGGMNGSSVSSNGGSNSDSSLPSGSDSKLCRDFIRNVCSRGKNCKFIHPENIKIRTEPIFCHDFQQGRCRRSTCKFIHCSREVEDHYKKTGELPDDVYDSENGLAVEDAKVSRRSTDGSSRNSKGGNRANGNGIDVSLEVPICKDFLKGACNRPTGSCKYRHVNSQNEFARNRGGRSLNGNGTTTGIIRRRGSDGLYDSGPDSKKSRSNDSSSFDFRGGEEFNEDFYVGNNINRGYSALHPQHTDARSHSIQNTTSTGHLHGAPDNHGFSQFHQNPANTTYAIAGSNRNGYSSAGAGDSSVAAYIQSHVSAEAVKALEDENFMLKRRIEELKTSNEFLLNQNAQLRLNTSLSVSRTSVGVENVQVQPTVGVTSGVVQTMVSIAQPMGMTPTLSVAATQPLSTISTLPTVSMPPVSITQALPLPVVSISHSHSQHQSQPQSVYPMVTTQGVLPQQSNLS